MSTKTTDKRALRAANAYSDFCLDEYHASLTGHQCERLAAIIAAEYADVTSVIAELQRWYYGDDGQHDPDITAHDMMEQLDLLLPKVRA